MTSPHPLESMHDWVLVSILHEWEPARITVLLRESAGAWRLIAEGTVELSIPHLKYWGPSVSVYENFGPLPVQDDKQLVRLQMQSGDVITIVAASFTLTRD